MADDASLNGSVMSEAGSTVSHKAMAKAEMKTNAQMVKDILNRPLPDFVREREPRQTPVQGLQYAKHWNTVDFVGKYHIHNFSNQNCPTPGTTIVQEQEHRKLKNDDVERFEQGLAARAAKRRIRLHVRTENALFQQKINMGTAIDRPIDEAQEILRKKEVEVEMQQNPRFPDTKKEIDRFMRNVLSGNHNYVLFAATLGYKSFNYQDPETGNSALHFAIKAGYVEMVDELLKYTADPNLRNRLGDTAILDCWYFWGTKKFNRTKEEREAQEEKAHHMILSILSYGGFVDSTNQKGETALHIACRMGTTQIVLTLLGFRANVNVVTKEGKTAAQVAEENHRHDIAKLFAIWEAIRHRFVHMDFLTLWRAFLRDFQAVITSERSAQAILLDLNMDMQVTRVDREVTAKVKGGLTIDDTLLRQTYTKMKNADAAAPKPWDPTWEAFVEECHAKGIFSHAFEAPPDDILEGASKKKKPDEVHADSDAGLTRAQLANKKLPDRILPEARPRTREATISSPSRGRSRRASSRPSIMAGKFGGDHSQSPSRSKSPGRSQSSGDSPFNVRLPTISLESIPSDTPFSPLETYSAANSRAGTMTGTTTFSSGNFNTLSGTAEGDVQRPVSAVQQRRIHSARLVALDAKFFRFTKRPATSSAMFLSLRSPTAPLDGTEEQKSIMRHITSQGKEYDLVAKNRKVDLRVRLGFAVKEPPKSGMGDYIDGIIVNINGERDLLYNKLNIKPMSDVEAIQAQMLAAAEERNKSKGAKEAVIQPKVDMVQDKRLRFVEPVVIPPARKLTLLERMAKERAQSAEEERKARLGIAGEAEHAAKQELMKSLLAPVDEDDKDDATFVGDGLIEEQAHKRKMKAKQQKKMRGVHLLMKKEIKYGAGRLRSSHNLTGKIEPPWSAVSGRFAVKPGDRSG